MTYVYRIIAFITPREATHHPTFVSPKNKDNKLDAEAQSHQGLAIEIKGRLKVEAGRDGSVVGLR
jgi:hypothetical protein